MTVGAIAGLLLAAIAVLLKAPVEIAGHEQVEPAVVVVVEEAGAGAPSAGGAAGTRGGPKRRGPPSLSRAKKPALALPPPGATPGRAGTSVNVPVPLLPSRVLR